LADLDGEQQVDKQLAKHNLQINTQTHSEVVLNSKPPKLEDEPATEPHNDTRSVKKMQLDDMVHSKPSIKAPIKKVTYEPKKQGSKPQEQPKTTVRPEDMKFTDKVEA